MIWKKKTIENLTFNMPLEDIKRIAKILIIDDDEQAFPYKLLQKEGYNVHYWDRVDNLKELENGIYDLIILDIYGVASKDMSINDGLGILEHIKKNNPSQLVIAYSGQKFDLSHSAFWQIADDYLGKPSSLITCKEKIDLLLTQKFKPSYYWKIIVDILKKEGISEIRISKFEEIVVDYSKKQKKIDLDTISKSLSIAHHSAAIIWVIVQIIIKFYIKI